MSNKLLIDAVKKLHKGLFFNTDEVVNEFKNAIKNNSKAVVHNSFNLLETEGRINQSSVYFFNTIEGKHEVVNKDQYDYAVAFKKDLVESLGVDFKQYTISYNSFNKSDEMKRIINEVEEKMVKVLKIHYMYEAIKVFIKDKRKKCEVPEELFHQAYFRKFIKLSVNRQNRNDYVNSEFFWRKFYLMNTLTLLSIILKERRLEVDGLEELLYEEKRRKSDEEFLDYSGDYEEEFKI